MCRRVVCEECGKPGFAGCGKHVEQVLGDVPVAERCGCHGTPSAKSEQNRAGSGSWLDALRKAMS